MSVTWAISDSESWWGTPSVGGLLTAATSSGPALSRLGEDPL